MEIFASIFAGLGMFFIGIRLIGNHLKQLAGRRLRMLITKAVAGRASVALFGLLAGATMQSVNAVTYVLVALLGAGAIEKRKAFPVISWANMGTSLLILVAALNMHGLILVLIGLTGVTFYLNLDQSSRYRHAVGALLGLGLLFLGIDFIKSGAAILKGTDGLKSLMLFARNFPPLSFGVGVAVAWLVQSSSTVTVVAMALSAAGLLPFDSGALVVLGAGLGSGLSALTLAGRLQGSARQLVLYQIALKTAGVAVMLLWMLLDWALGSQLLASALQSLHLSASAQLAAVYVLLQIVSGLSMAVLGQAVERLLERRSPVSDEERLGRPQYLQDDAMVEPETALLLVHKEQQRLLAHLPAYLENLREDVQRSGLSADTRYAAEAGIVRYCDQFLTELADRNHSRSVLSQTIVLRDRNELLGSLQESLLELNRVLQGGGATDEVARLINNLTEALHLMLESLADAAASMDVDDLAMLRALTHDRSELMDSIRRRMLGETVSAEVQRAVFSATSVFERCVWLLRRYVMLLEVPGAGAAD